MMNWWTVRSEDAPPWSPLNLLCSQYPSSTSTEGLSAEAGRADVCASHQQCYVMWSQRDWLAVSRPRIGYLLQHLEGTVSPRVGLGIFNSYLGRDNLTLSEPLIVNVACVGPILSNLVIVQSTHQAAGTLSNRGYQLKERPQKQICWYSCVVFLTASLQKSTPHKT